jgi:hypothetical protein
MTDTKLLTPSELQNLAEQGKLAKVQAQFDHVKKEEEERKALHEAFMGREIDPNVKELVNAAVRRAAEQGLHEVQMLTFPADFCNDRGRRINNGEPDWPDSLEGFAKKAMLYFEKELKPLGFKARAKVLTFPGGMPGDIGLFLGWGG